MNMNKERGKTPLEARQERLRHLREIYVQNKEKVETELELLYRDYLLSQGLSPRKIEEYLDLMFWYAKHGDKVESMTMRT